MDLDPNTAIQHLISKTEHDERMKLSRAQEMAQLAEATRNKTKATYRYSLVAYIREVVEMRANEGFNDAIFRSKALPWTNNEIQAVIPFLENDDFKVKFEDEMERQYNSVSAMTGIDGSGVLKPNGYKILTVTW